MATGQKAGLTTRASLLSVVLTALVVIFTGCGSLDSDLDAQRRNAPQEASATLVASCNPCKAGEVVRFTGEGYDASQYKAYLSFGGGITSTPVWSDGTISHSWPYYSQAGTYKVESYQKGKGKKMELKASVTVNVE